MVGTSSVEVKCTKCGNVYEAQVIDHVDMSQDFETAKTLKTGKVNRTQCSKCKKVMFLDRGVVINFEPDPLIVVFDPSAKSSAAQAELKQSYDNIVRFNETLQEVGEEVQFKVMTDLEQLKGLIDEYIKKYK